MRSKELKLLALTLLVSALPARAALIEVAEEPPVDSDPAIRAVFTPEVAQALLSSSTSEIHELTPVEESEARAAGHLHDDPSTWGRPWFIVKAGLGLPNLIGAYIEIFVRREWTVGIGTGTGLLPPVIEGTIRWRPDATCWGCDGKNFLSLGFGIDPAVYWTQGLFHGNTGVMVTASVDLLYIHRFTEHFGLTLGTQLGVGGVTEFGGTQSFKVEPTFKINLIQVGFAF
ncbi:MAG TPA: hypothetical protein VL588_02020 [Bdellovibrionota bacterium]|jgi:hypothetical protein|nr:hypothetical protein [Bdellovibrionota bacterium]